MPDASIARQRASFSSAPWCLNGHIHTILCSLLFDSPPINSERTCIETPDGDFLELDIHETSPGADVAVLFHGLEGDSRRYYITQLASHLHQRGFSTVSVNFRGCSGRQNRNRRFYHSGETEDPHTIFKWVEENFPGSQIFAAGFSLGGSTLLNYLNQHGTHHPLRATAVISTPFDLHQGSLNLEKGFNRIYSLRFLRTLVQKLKEKRKAHPDLPSFSGRTIYEFDDQVTAPLHGFEGADDYYAQCSSAFFMDRIKTDTLVVHSLEDPICPHRWTPVSDIEKNPALTPCFTQRGGHVGFWSLPPGWLNKTVADYFETIR